MITVQVYEHHHRTHTSYGYQIKAPGVGCYSMSTKTAQQRDAYVDHVLDTLLKANRAQVQFQPRTFQPIPAGGRY